MHSSCWTPSTGLPPAGEFLWRWSFPVTWELPNAFHCFLTAAWLCWVPFPAAAQGGEHQEGTTFVLSQARQEAGASLMERMCSRDTREQRDSAPGHGRACCPQPCASTEWQQWHCPMAGLCNEVDATRR